MSRVFSTPIIYLITKGEATASNFPEKRQEILDIIRVATEEKISLVQLREKNLPARLLFELAVDAAALTRGTTTSLLVNDRADIAVAAGADGVQLTADSLSADVIRKSFPEEFLVGVSTHSTKEALNAVCRGADLVVFGPVFETPGKGVPAGLAALEEVCDHVESFPVIAIGGIGETNYRKVLAAGAAGFAAIRALNNVEHLRSLVQLVRKAKSGISDR